MLVSVEAYYCSNSVMRIIIILYLWLSQEITPMSRFTVRNLTSRVTLIASTSYSKAKKHIFVGQI